MNHVDLVVGLTEIRLTHTQAGWLQEIHDRKHYASLIPSGPRAIWCPHEVHSMRLDEWLMRKDIRPLWMPSVILAKMETPYRMCLTPLGEQVLEAYLEWRERRHQ